LHPAAASAAPLTQQQQQQPVVRQPTEQQLHPSAVLQMQLACLLLWCAAAELQAHSLMQPLPELQIAWLHCYPVQHLLRVVRLLLLLLVLLAVVLPAAAPAGAAALGPPHALRAQVATVLLLLSLLRLLLHLHCWQVLLLLEAAAQPTSHHSVEKAT
jgi:hypothetical protein